MHASPLFRAGFSSSSRRAVARSLALFALAAASASSAAPRELTWRREPWGQGERAALAIAVAPRAAWVAIGDASGITLVRDASVARRLARAGVRDLAFASDGALWVASEDGLFRVEPERNGAFEDRSPAPGAAARAVARLAVDGAWIAAATESGVFVSHDGGSWSEVDGAAPRGAASAVVLRCAAVCALTWIVDGGIWQADLEARAGRLAARGARELRVANAPAGAAPVDLAIVDGAAFALYEAGLAALEPHSALAGRLVRFVLPPGASARRLTSALGRYWLASDRGLLHAERLDAAFERAAPPAGWLATSAVAAEGDAIFVATASGVVSGRLREGVEPVRARSAESEAPRSSDVARELRALHRLVLEHQGLDVERQRRWRDRAARRGRWPSLDLHAGYGGDRGRGVDYDQTFTSGSTQNLVDRARDRGDDWDVGLSLQWDLANAVLDGETIDVAREERLWISLRDDVLDEVNQLYFERRRTLRELEGLEDPASLDAARLRIRAEELAAGLDAWTGGAFSRALAGPESPARGAPGR